MILLLILGTVALLVKQILTACVKILQDFSVIVLLQQTSIAEAKHSPLVQLGGTVHALLPVAQFAPARQLALTQVANASLQASLVPPQPLTMGTAALAHTAKVSPEARHVRPQELPMSVLVVVSVGEIKAILASSVQASLVVNVSKIHKPLIPMPKHEPTLPAVVKWTPSATVVAITEIYVARSRSLTPPVLVVAALQVRLRVHRPVRLPLRLLVQSV
jgi:hypothetical protein